MSDSLDSPMAFDRRLNHVEFAHRPGEGPLAIRLLEALGCDCMVIDTPPYGEYIVVSLDGWAKIRDSEGTLAWIERKFLAERRSLIVTASRAEIRQANNESSPLVFEAEKNVSLDYLEASPGGWIKVRHRDGQSGYVRANQVWGI